MTRVRWAPAALRDVRGIDEYLTDRSPAAAQRVVEQIFTAAESLKRNRARGRPGRISGTRELVLAPLPYLIIYEIETDGEDIVRIMRVVHGAMRWPPW